MTEAALPHIAGPPVRETQAILPKTDHGQERPKPGLKEHAAELWGKIRNWLPFWKEEVKSQPQEVVEQLARLDNQGFPDAPPINVIDESTRSLPEVGEKDKEGGYSPEQMRYINEHYGLKVDQGNVLITRTQASPDLPTVIRSCSVVVPEQNSFYGDAGYFFEVPTQDIPWVTDGDAGTPMTTNEIPKPKEAYELGEYLTKGSFSEEYNETAVKFGKGLPEKARALYDFREIPPKPSITMRVTKPTEYADIIARIRYIESSRLEWQQKANELGVPFLMSLPDQKLVSKVREHERRVQENYDAWVKSQAIGY